MSFSLKGRYWRKYLFCPMEVFLIVFVQFIAVVWCNSTEVCTNLHDKFTCEYGCCGDYRKERCCSFAGTIVGIVIGAALFIGVIAGLVYCYIKKRGKTGSIFPCGGNRSVNPHGTQRRQPGRVTVIQTTHCYNAGRGRRGIQSAVAGYEGIVPYSDSNEPSVKPPMPPAYEPALPPPPPYSSLSGRTSTGINTMDNNYDPTLTTPPVS
ncbi:cysteine and tyrosine-rich protein 1-like [Argopecten irradians]|uniref:cysteine and tyrosine-rich protein 1-like n=1 Tax=Argopecten irradians TaxID=31199 RepID=UPI00371C8480